MCCSVLQNTFYSIASVNCTSNTLQHTVTRCNTRQRTATHFLSHLQTFYSSASVRCIVFCIYRTLSIPVPLQCVPYCICTDHFLFQCLCGVYHMSANTIDSVSQCAAVCCRVLQGVAGCCSALRCVAVCCSVL